MHPSVPGSAPAQVLVLAKEPRPGFVKTRLTPGVTPEAAADLAAAAIDDTLAAALLTGLPVRLVLDGAPGDWVPAGVTVLPQCGGGLGERLEAAFLGASRLLPAPMVLVGMDTPQVTADALLSVLAELYDPGVDAVLGMSPDGGWWVLALRDPLPGAFEGVPMSADDTGAEQLRRLRELGLRVRLTTELLDVDTIEDAHAVARLQPEGSRFRTVLATVLAVAPVPV